MFDVVATLALRRWSPACVRLEVAGDDAGRVEQIRQLEELKRAASAAQARIAAELVASQRAEQVAAGVPNRRAHRGVGEQVALARGESPHRGGTFVGMATALVHEMPCTMAALSGRPDHRVDRDLPGARDRGAAGPRPHRGRRPAGRDARAAGHLHRPAHPGRQGPGPEARPAVGGGQGRQGRGRPHGDDPAGAGHDGLRQRAAAGGRGRGVLRRAAPGRRPGRGDRRPALAWAGDGRRVRREGHRPRPADRARGRARRPGDDRHHPARPRPRPGARSAPAGRSPSRSPARSPAPWSPAPVRPGGPGCAGSTPPPTAPPWSRWTPAPAASPSSWPTWSSCPTSPAAPRGATPRSPRPTTSRTTPTTAPPPATTPKASADAATSPSKHPAGPPQRDPDGTVTTTTPTGHTYSSHPPPVLGHPPTGVDRTRRPAQPHHARLAPPHGLRGVGCQADPHDRGRRAGQRHAVGAEHGAVPRRQRGGRGGVERHGQRARSTG